MRLDAFVCRAAEGLSRDFLEIAEAEPGLDEPFGNPGRDVGGKRAHHIAFARAIVVRRVREWHTVILDQHESGTLCLGSGPFLNTSVQSRDCS